MIKIKLGELKRLVREASDVYGPKNDNDLYEVAREVSNQLFHKLYLKEAQSHNNRPIEFVEYETKRELARRGYDRFAIENVLTQMHQDL